MDQKELTVDCAWQLGYGRLKEKQLAAIISYIQGNDTSVSLSTG